LASLGTKVGILLALPLSSSHGQGFGQWTTAGDFEQASQLGLGHRSAAPARVGLLIRLRHPRNGFEIIRPMVGSAHQLQNAIMAAR